MSQDTFDSFINEYFENKTLRERERAHRKRICRKQRWPWREWRPCWWPSRSKLRARTPPCSGHPGPSTWQPSCCRESRPWTATRSPRRRWPGCGWPPSRWGLPCGPVCRPSRSPDSWQWSQSESARRTRSAEEVLWFSSCPESPHLATCLWYLPTKFLNGLNTLLILVKIYLTILQEFWRSLSRILEAVFRKNFSKNLWKNLVSSWQESLKLS